MNEELKKVLNRMLQEMAHQTDLMEQILDRLDEIGNSYTDYFVEDEDEDVEEYVDEDDEYGFYDPDDIGDEDDE